MLYLASQSPRRFELLSLLYPNRFEVIESCYEEDNELEISPTDMVMQHASGKAKGIDINITNGLVIGVDTIVVLKDKVLGKPKNDTQAIAFLQNLSGQWIEVISGVALRDLEKEEESIFSVSTAVKMKTLSDKEIQGYVATGEPRDKAGAFAVQGIGSIFIERLEGDFYNVVGLPLYHLHQQLSARGFSAI